MMKSFCRLLVSLCLALSFAALQNPIAFAQVSYGTIGFDGQSSSSSGLRTFTEDGITFEGFYVTNLAPYGNPTPEIAPEDTTGSAGTTPARFFSAAGDAFELTSVQLDNYAGIAIDITLVGYLSGSPVSGASVTFSLASSSGGSYATFDVVSAASAFSEVDEVRITSSPIINNSGDAALSVAFDNIVVAAASSSADTTPPSVSVISVVGSPAANAASVDYTVTFDENANNISTDDFSVTQVSGSASGSVGSVSASSGTSVTVTVDSISGDGDIRLNLLANTNITDDSGNGNGTNGHVAAFTSGDTHTVDRVAPAAPSTPDMTAATDTGVSDTDNLTSDATPTFEGTAEAGATVTLISSVDGTVGTATASGGNWSITASTLTAGAHTITATATDAASNTSPASSGLSITVDTTAPTISSIVRQSPASSPTSADSVVFRITFTEPVSNVDFPDFNALGTTGDVTSVSGSGAVYDLTVSGGDMASLDGAVSISFDGAQNIEDVAGNALTDTSVSGTNQAFLIDNTAPVLDAFERQTPAGALTNANTLVFRATFDSDVSNVSTDDFDVTGSSATVTSFSAVTGSSVFDLTVSGGDLASYDGTVGLDLAATQNIADETGFALPGTEPVTDETYTLDNTAPSGFSATLDQDPVTAANATAVSFTFAGAEPSADYSYTITSSGGGGSVSNTGTISGASDQITGIDVSGLPDGTLTLSVTLTDPAGNPGTAATDTATKDAQPPRLDTISRQSPADALTNADNPVFRVVFNEAMTTGTVNPADFAVSGAGAGGASLAVSAVGGTGDTTFDVTVSGVASNDGALDLGLTGAPTLDDSGGNTLTDTSALGAVEGYTLDNTAPSASGITLVGTPGLGATSVDFTVNFSEAVNNVTTDDFALTNTGGVTANIASVSASSGSSLTVTVDTIAGAGTLRLDLSAGADIADDAGNGPPAAFTSGAVHNVDRTQPEVDSITVSGSPGAGDTSVTFQVAFTEAVNNVSTDDFALTATGGASGTIDSVSAASGTTIDVTVNAIAGEGSLRLDLLGGTDIVDGASIGPPAAFTSGDAHTVDRVGPSPVSFERSGGAAELTNADSLSWTVTFNEAVDNVEAADFAVTGPAATLAVSGTGATRTVTASGGSVAGFNGAVGLNFSGGAAYTDLAGNAGATGEPATDETYTLDNDAPALLAFARQTPTDATTDADTLVFAITFDGAVENVTADDFDINGTTANGVLAGGGAAYTLTVSGGDLAELNAVVSLDLAGGQNIADAAGNAVPGGEPPTDEAYTLENDEVAPQLASIERRTPADETTAADTLVFRASFSEAVQNVTGDDFGVSGTSASVTGVAPASASVYDLTVSGGDLAGLNGEVGLSLEPGQDIADLAGNALVDTAVTGPNETYTLDNTAPEPAIELPGAETTGVFTATITFPEAVSGFDLAGITVENGAADALSGSGDSYTVEITPDAPGTVTITIAAGAGADAAGNDSLAASAEIEAVSSADPVVIVSGQNPSEPGGVVATTNLTNPGGAPLEFNSTANVDWLNANPSSGTIPALGSTQLEVSLTDAVKDLPAGQYSGVVTVSAAGGSAGSASASSAAAQSAGLQSAAPQATGAILLEIPVTLTLEARFGALEIVVTTPPAAGEASFAFQSEIEAFDEVSLTTSGGVARQAEAEVLAGEYAIAQIAPEGWKLDAVSCAGDADGGSSFDVDAATGVIDLDVGESLVCTFENVRDDAAVQLATQRAIRNFMVRRADRLIQSAPDLSRRFSEHATTRRGGFAADISGRGAYNMAFSGSLAGLRNAAAAETPAVAGLQNPERPFMDGWDVWLSVELSGVSDDRGGDSAESTFGVAQLGLDRQLSDQLILGVMAQYDWMDETAEEVFQNVGAVAGATVEGEGWMAGPYAVWRLRDSLILDASALYGRSDNQVNPLGLYEDDFETDRFMLRANLTGQFAAGPLVVRPQAGITHFEETQSGYTDSLGITIPEQTVSIGRLRAGPELAWRRATADGGWLELNTRINAIWDYQAAELLNEAGFLDGGDENLRADARLGLAALTGWGGIVRLEGGFDGLGVGDFEATTGRVEIRIPFGAPGAGGMSGGFAPGRQAGGRLGGMLSGNCSEFSPGFEDIAQPGRADACMR